MNAIESPKNPCILVCVIEQSSGYCYGCGRTSGEIANWSTMGAAGRKALMAELPSRVSALERNPRRQTRRRRLAGQRSSVQSRDEIA